MLSKILDNNYYDLVIFNTLVPAYNTGDNITTLSERHSLLHILKTDMEPCDLGTYPYYRFPLIFTLESTVSIEKSGIGTVHRNPFLDLFGRGILIGVIDTGIDYRHPAFLNRDGTSRILSIWDQTEQGGTSPEGFTFGTEYTRAQIDLALKSDDPLSIVPSTDTNGHGTAIASIIAGSPNEEQDFTGIVPESDLVIVKLKEAKRNLKNIFFVPEDSYCFQESDIILGVTYLRTVFQKMNRPLIICNALGSSQGGHDGHGLLSSYFNYLVQLPGIGVSVSAGNEGNKRRHYFNSTSSEPYFNDFELRIGENDKQFCMEIWPYAPGRLTIDISSPNRESTKRIYPELNECRRFKFIFSDTTIWVNNIFLETKTGNQLILIRFDNPAPGIWYLRAQNIENQPFSFHCWLPNGDLISDETFFVLPFPDTTITSPGNGSHQLTVTAYNQFNDSILAESSRGYTRNGLVKPDIAAPGYQLPCAVPENQYGTLTGTGAAAAHTAGAIAMIMEWAIPKGNYVTMNGYIINRMLIRAANRTITETYPNNIWGYGQLDLYKLFERLTSI